MKGYIGNTDHRWFEFLRDLAEASPAARAAGCLDEVNFWKPGGGRNFRAIEPGAPFFFRLKAPFRRIGGFGTFARYVELPDWLAWETFGTANGASTSDQFVALVDNYRGRRDDAPTGHHPAGPSPALRRVGCILVTEAHFLPDEAHVAEPKGWAGSIVAGKSLDLTEGEGLRIYENCLTAARSLGLGDAGALIAEPGARYGAPRLVAPRLGQGTFRISVMEAYERACAVTTEHSLPVLEAAHIQPYAAGGPHEVSNGIFLRSDLHALFDLGYLTLSDDHRLELGGRLRADYGNGRAYETLHGQRLNVPLRAEDRPAREFVRWHQEHVFRG